MTADFLLDHQAKQRREHPPKKPLFPKIGLRILKSAVAVFLCFVIYLLRGCRGVPFYSAIAAILCMQPYVANSLKVALNRTIGTLIGGALGLPILLLELRFFPAENSVLKYLLVSAMVIPLIYLTLLVKKPSASYITCVVFLSVTVSHVTDPNPYLFAINRMLDTLIGIFVSLGVNSIRIPRHKNKNLLLVAGLDKGIAGEDGTVSSFSRVKINQLVSRGAKITLATARTPATALPMLEELDLKLPVVVMGGAALYDVKTRRYTHVKTIRRQDAKMVFETVSAGGHNCFVHSVIHDMLHIYYQELKNPVEREYYAAMRGTLHKNYVCGVLPEPYDAICLMAVMERRQARELEAALLELPCAERLRIIRTPDTRGSGYEFVEVFSREASYHGALELLKAEYGLRSAVVFGGGEALLQAGDQAYGAREIQKRPDETAFYDADGLVRQMAWCFYGRNKI